MCMAENERQRRGERCWSDQKSFCVKYNKRKGSKNVGENQRFTKCFQFKALAKKIVQKNASMEQGGRYLAILRGPVLCANIQEI